MKTKLLSLTLAAGLIVISGCALKKTGNLASGSCSAALYEPKEAFRRSLQPELVKNCASCHGSVNTAPAKFAATDPAVGYADAKGLVDFASIKDSDLVYRVESVHHNCGSDAKCAAIGAAFRTQIKAWWDLGENPNAVRCGSVGGGNAPPIEYGVRPEYITAVLTVPAGLSKTVDTFLTFNLAAASPAVPGAHLRLGARRVLDATAATLGTFQLRDPRLATSLTKYRISNLHIFINENDTSYLNYLGISFVVAPQAYDAASNTWPFFRMSTRSQDIVYEPDVANGSQDTRIRIGFDIVESGDAPSPDPGSAVPPDQVFFNTQVSPLLNQRCAACHGAGRTLNLSGSIDQDRLSATALSNRASPTTSTLYTKGTGTVGHGGGNALPLAAERATLVQWMQSLP